MGGSSSREKKPAAQVSSSALPVRLNVYSPTGGQHAVYHTGVEVLEAEYVFGGGDTSFSGVTLQRPRIAPQGSGWTFYQTVDIGTLRCSREEALRVIAELRGEFPASSYDLVSRNCNHFSDALCQRLCGQGIPSWVNRLAGIGNAVRGAVGAGPAPADGNARKAEGGAGGPAAAGLVVRSVAPDGDLAGEVDWTGVGVLNAREADASAALRAGACLSSEEDGSPELLLLIPFVSPVKMQTLRVESPDASRAPARTRFFANQRNLDMDDAAGGVVATQEASEIAWSRPAPGSSVVTATIELNFLKFQNLGFVAIYFARDEDGASVAVQGVRLLGRV